MSSWWVLIWDEIYILNFIDNQYVINNFFISLFHLSSVSGIIIGFVFYRISILLQGAHVQLDTINEHRAELYRRFGFYPIPAASNEQTTVLARLIWWKSYSSSRYTIYDIVFLCEVFNYQCWSWWYCLNYVPVLNPYY